MNRPIVENKIAEVLKLHPKGSVFFVDDFLDYGNSESVKKALLRLKEKEILVRLAHGIYLYPKIDTELGVLFPSTEDIARAIARRDKAKIVPTGVQALNKLGLSTQVPMRVVYLTDGATRSIKVGKRTISFKNTSPKNLLAVGEISGLSIQALKTIGKTKVDDEVILKIQTLLKKEKTENIIKDAKLAPVWINKILIQSIR
jgi:predicted transcriptional regulator of viral defense system